MSSREVAAIAEPLLGANRHVAGVERLRGGSKKGVYRLLLGDGSRVVMYLWRPEESYWPEVRGAERDVLGDASGLALFLASHDELRRAGVRVPEVLALPESLDEGVALVEDINGGTLEALLLRDPKGSKASLGALADQLRRMHLVTAESAGKVGHLSAADHGTSKPEDVVVARGLADLKSSAPRVPQLAPVQREVEEALLRRRAAVHPRATFRLIHGELGPDHVLVTAGGEPVMIDIEGAMFFDVEWEHAFLEIRFGTSYPWLRDGELDQSRLELYRLALYLSLVAGPLRLLDGDFPERSVMQHIIDVNLGRVITAVGRPPT